MLEVVKDIDSLNVKSLADVDLSSPVVGVYFLMDIEECVYIGSSINIIKRIGEHQVNVQKEGTFSSVKIMELDKHEMEGIERFLIKNFKPRLNITGTGFNRTRVSLTVAARGK